MKTVMTKTLLAAALTAVMGVASNSAMALLNPFEVTEASVPGAIANPALLSPNSAGKITGNYTEVATFGSAVACGTSVCGLFDTSLLWNAGQYVAPNGSTVLASQLGGIFPQQYQMYAFFQGNGSFITTAGKTTFTFAPGGSLDVFIDPSSNTQFVAPALGTAAWTTSGVTASEDYEIASGVPKSGTGVLDPTLPTCLGGGINCGSFGTTTSFMLTALGLGYFTSPVPFYNVSFQSGQFDNFTPTATQTVHGSLDATFGIPEPESLALLGIGLLGLGMARRGRKQA